MPSRGKIALLYSLLFGFASLCIAAAQPQAASNAQSANQPLRQLIIADSIEAAQKAEPAPGKGFVVVNSPSLSFLNLAELTKRLASGEGKNIDDKLLAAIVLVIEALIRETDFAAGTAIIPPQSISGGIVRVAVQPGRIRDIKLQGAHWFSESLLREKLRLERGETIRISELDRAINWANSNPFRRLRVHIQPIADTGEADLVVNVEERRPLRLFASYDNTGNEVLGENRYTAGLNLGNVWGRDHQASYQFITSDDIDAFSAHAIDYRMPMPWRHVLNFSASYVLAEPTFYDGLFTQKGKSITADAKYVVPLHTKRWRAEASAGIGFKQTNNNLEFSGIPQIGATIDVLTASLSLAGVRTDKRGSWVASGMVTGSPGTFNSRSERYVYEDSRLGANPRFVYGLLSLQRSTTLTPTTTSHARAMFQHASSNLVPTEQFALGGLATVRGYDERILSADMGYSFTHELQQRFVSATLSSRLPKLDLSGLFFWDYGRVFVKHTQPGQRSSDYLASAGIGARITMGNNLACSIDYARQLEKVEIPGAAHDRVHVRVNLSY